MRERLKFSDHLVQGELYKPWKPFKHPTYGDIEIGGWIKFSSRMPAPFMLKDEVHRNASAVIFTAKQTPDIKLEIMEVKKMDKGIFRIRTRLSNSQAIPTMSYHAQKVKLYPQDMLKLSGKNVKVLAGGLLNNVYLDRVTYKEFRPDVQLFFVPGFGKVDHQFLVFGKGTATIEYKSRHGGKLKKTIKLR